MPKKNKLEQTIESLKYKVQSLQEIIEDPKEEHPLKKKTKQKQGGNSSK